MDKLTKGEQRIFTLGILCATEGLKNMKVDYAKLAISAGLKNGASASVLFNKAKSKFLANSETEGLAKDVSKPATPNKVVKPRAKKAPATGKGKSKATKKGMDDAAGAIIKSEPDAVMVDGDDDLVEVTQGGQVIKEEPSFAEGIIDGTSYPIKQDRSGDLWAISSSPRDDSSECTMDFKEERDI
ncbi:hypothetical protein FQN57_000834 [Myotisia sp. PD_48]|nr:hypothetical protein FQN57_000834 [Myotisia sp. PD_48]